MSGKRDRKRADLELVLLDFDAVEERRGLEAACAAVQVLLLDPSAVEMRIELIAAFDGTAERESVPPACAPSWCPSS